MCWNAAKKATYTDKEKKIDYRIEFINKIYSHKLTHAFSQHRIVNCSRGQFNQSIKCYLNTIKIFKQLHCVHTSQVSCRI